MTIRFTAARLRCRALALALSAALALLAAPALVRAQDEAASVQHASELREAPGDGSRVLEALPAGAALSRTGERQGPWVRVRTASGNMGWVHLFDLGPASGSGNGTGGNVFTGALRGVKGFFTKPTNQPVTTATSTIGIRGLGAEDIANAQPDEAAVGRMETLRISESDARRFAREASLAPVRVDPLPVPAREQGAAPQENLP